MLPKEAVSLYNQYWLDGPSEHPRFGRARAGTKANPMRRSGEEVHIT